MIDLALLRKEFIERFRSPPHLFRAPGRVNLIGEHTDYNAGFVMPMAIPFNTILAISPRTDRRLRVSSSYVDETCEVDLPGAGEPQRPLRGAALWIDYVRGVAGALQRHGVPLVGANLLIRSDLPVGAGLSSSAALEVVVCIALASLGGRALDPIIVARLCQQAENEYVGMRCGIMDQMASACGRAGHALKIDCRSLDYELIPVRLHTTDGKGAQLVICNTMARHRHAGGAYNQRREQCEEGVKSLQRLLPQVLALRDVTPSMLREHEQVLDPVIFRRCRHVVTENQRVIAAAAALEAYDLPKMGALMSDSHRSLRDDFEVSCRELDCMASLAESIEGVYGARMTGGGFGGCTLSLVRSEAVPEFRTLMAARYTGATGLVPDIYLCEPAEGAGPMAASADDAGIPA